ncbi:MAG TPA: hypothetical protein VIU41_02175 [Geobacteraceae bacterium]
MPRLSTCFLAAVTLLCSLAGAAVWHAAARQLADRPDVITRRAMVKGLRLTDLCLFTDTRYARNPSLADRHTPFQDSPMSFEHYPSGSLLLPPPHLRAHGLD